MTLPAPYYADEWCTLYHADNRDVLPYLEAVDHTITDPPYESEAHTHGRRARAVGGGEIYDERPLDFEPIDDVTRVQSAGEIARLTKRWQLVFCQVEAAMKWRHALEAGGARYVRTCVWTKPDSTPQFTGDRPGMGYESIVACHSAHERLRWNGGGRRGVFEFTGDHDRVHMTQKPQRLVRELVRLFTDRHETVLDCFAGSGTLAVACRDLGRRCILVEREEKYCRLIVERLRQMPLPGTAPAAKPEQVSLLDEAGE